MEMDVGILWCCAAGGLSAALRARHRALPPTDAAGPCLSKNAAKRLLRTRQWEESGRARMKERARLKRAAKAARRRDARRGELAALSAEQRHARIGAEHAARSAAAAALARAAAGVAGVTVAVCVDCSFDVHNRDFESTSLVRQLVGSYAVVRRQAAAAPARDAFSLHVCGVARGGRVAAGLDKLNARAWQGVAVHEGGVAHVFGGGSQGSQGSQDEGDDDAPEGAEGRRRRRRAVVVLSPDAEEVLPPTLRRDEVYVIGGMVDNQRIMHTTSREAARRGVRCCRLPVKETLGGKVDCVLNVNTVVEVLAVLHETGCWKQALALAVPQRKQRRQQQQQQQQ